jgi:hypothetical protein
VANELMKNVLRNLGCRALGHQPIKLDTNAFQAICKRCGEGLIVSYDMSYGNTIVVGIQPGLKG